MSVRHFVDIDALPSTTLRDILEEAKARKAARAGKGKAEVDEGRPLDGKLLAMVFEKPSTRTRISFDVAMRQLGGQTVIANSADMQIGRGESIADTARVLSRYVDVIMLRTHAAEVLDEMVRHATVPVINGLTDATHPCQLMADVMTFEEHKGDIAGQVVTWSGDGNNMANSWIQGAARFGYELRIATPETLRPSEAAVAWANGEGARVTLTDDLERALDGADGVVTDSWVSMGDQDSAHRHNLLAPYQINERAMALAKPDAVFMHCLPAHRGEEVTDGVIDGAQSIVWDQAENRLHAQKSILAWCLT